MGSWLHLNLPVNLHRYQVAGAEVHREAIAASGEQAGSYTCVIARIIMLAWTVGSAVWPGGSQELPLPCDGQSRPQLSTICPRGTIPLWW